MLFAEKYIFVIVLYYSSIWFTFSFELVFKNSVIGNELQKV